ncbi:MAG: DUF4012 domain-containing protein [Candidatus Brennerbacteria bacterium]|nr:DUF4012 domain-containing protein [Candidatus Brennerbacteria bacterium]
MVDVKGPRGAHRKALGKPVVLLAHRAHLTAPKRSSRFHTAKARLVMFTVIATLVVGTGGLYAGFRAARSALVGHGTSIADHFSRAVDALKTLDFVAASTHFEANEEELEKFSKIIGTRDGPSFAGVLGGVVPAVGEAASLARDTINVNANFLALTNSLATLRAEGLVSFMGDGVAILASLSDARRALQAIIASAQNIKNATGRLKSVAPYFDTLDSFVGERYLAWSGKLYALDEFLGALTSLLSSDTDRHILLMFQNPSEIRPAGGFLGSYADLTVRNGAMQKLDVRDIYDPDGQLAAGYRSPEAFGEWTEWKARDANWFFDFPTSAEAVLSLIEASKMYEDYGVKFDMVIGVNFTVIESLLNATGPVALSEYNLVLDDENFLREVQREVELGKDKAAGKPKRILQALTPVLLERLASLDGETPTDLVHMLKTHYERKDLMFYAREPKLARFIRDAGGDGGVYSLPSGFWGNYLAVVDANLDGKKSDFVITQKVDIYVDIATDGAFLTDVSVTRTHRGDLERELFWRATNRNYIQIYTPPSAELVFTKGNDPAPKGTELTAREVEHLYPAEKSIEMTKKFASDFQAWTFNAFGKKAFAAWMNVAAGKSRTLEVRYQTPGKTGEGSKAGEGYTFVYERQSGVPTKLSLTIAAPVGFTWRETETSRFAYETDDIPGRLIVNLTLTKQ